MFLVVIDKTVVPNVYVVKDAALDFENPSNHSRFLYSKNRLDLNETYSCKPYHSWISDENVYTQFGSGIYVQAIYE